MLRHLSLMVILPVLGVMALPGVSRAQQEKSVEDFNSLREQAVHYLRRKHYAPAWAKISAALKAPDGADDFKTNLTAAQIAHRQLRLEVAFARVTKAVELAEGDREVTRATKLLATLDNWFAGVRLTQAKEQQGKVKAGYIHLEAPDGIINKDKKELFRRIRTQFKETKVSLPTTIYLPFGKYTANLAPFEIKKGETADIVTFLDTGDQKEGGMLWWLVGGVAASAVVAVTVALVVSGEDDAAPQQIEVEEISMGVAP